MSIAPSALPGWYPDPSTGARRWWDGSAWAEPAPPVAARSNGFAQAGFIIGLGTAILVVAMAAIQFTGVFYIAFVPSVLAIIFSSIGLGRRRSLGDGAAAGWGLALGIGVFPLYVVTRLLMAVLFATPI